MLDALYDDDDFRNYSFCEIWNPSLAGGGPSEDQLFELVDKARKGDRSSPLEFGDTMYWTLRQPAFECFQRDIGPRPITYAEYFYAKLQVFFEILLYEETWFSPEHKSDPHPRWEGRTLMRASGPQIDPEEIERTLFPDDSERVNWVEPVRLMTLECHDRLAALRGWLQRQAQARVATLQKRSGWSKNGERDTVILNCLRRGMQRQEICEELDKRTIPTLPSLQAREIFTWMNAWATPDGYRAIQRLFSKLAVRLKAVKPLAVSK